MLHFKHSLYCACLLLLLSCSKKEAEEVKVPDSVLSEEVFTKVLRDFALAESAANINVKNVPYQKIDSAYAFDPLKENKVTQAQYDSTISFYVRHPDLYKKVYEDVLAALSDLQTKRNPAIRDSTSK
jgi:hypothetical protein